MLALTPRLNLAFALTLSACGARSALLDDGAGGDSSGAGASAVVAPVGATASGFTTTGGEGGFEPCTEPTVQPPAPLFDPLNGMPVHDFALVRRNDIAVMTARFTSGSQSAPDRIGHTSWYPWGGWPPSPHAPLDTAPSSWATAPVFASSSNELEMSYLDFPGCVQWVAARLDPKTTYPSPGTFPVAQVVGQGCGRVPRAVARAPSGKLATATMVPSGVGNFVETAVVSADGTVVTYDLPACGGLPLYADVAVLGDEIVIATSQVGPGYGCNDPSSLPNAIGIGWLGSGEFSSLFWMDADDPAGIQLLPRPGGLWFLFRESGASAFTTPPVWAVQFDEELNPMEIVQATSEGISRFAAAPLENGGFVIVSDETIGSGLLQLRAYGPSGELLAEHAIPTGDPVPSADRLSIVAAPAAAGAVVGWTRVDGRGYAARVDCMLGIALP
jgi:hypothetical protein